MTEFPAPPPPNSPAGKDRSLAERKGVCRRCGRLLKNPKYLAAGIGPVCIRKGLGNTGQG